MSKITKDLKQFYRIQRVNFRRNYYSVFGGDRYQKFIIITYARTGSNLLMSYLNSHKNIEAKGELFRDIRGKTSHEVWNQFFSKKNKTIAHAGFKLFYTHPFHTDDRTVWEIISKDKDIRIIHLVRENKIRTYLSGEIAKKTDKWTKKGSSKISVDDKRIEVDLDNFFERLNKIKEYEDQARESFKEHPFVEISYEQLVNDKSNTLNELYDFLKVDRSEAKTSYKKQNSETLKDLISNYDEFITKVKASEFSGLLSLEA